MISLPRQPNAYSLPVWTQTNDSDVNGSLYSSFNIDLTENEGKVRLGKRLVLNTGSADDSNMGIPIAFKTFLHSGGSPSAFAVAGAYIWSQAISTGYPSATPFTKLTAGSAPTTCVSNVSDMEILSGTIYVTTFSTTTYYSTDGVNWSSFTSGAGASGVTHMLCNFQNRMYMTDNGNTVVSWDTARTLASITNPYTVDLSAYPNLWITFIKASSNRIWIGTLDQYAGKGYIFEWDGVATQVTKPYRLDASGALSCVIKDDIPYITDSNGNLSYWNGGTFVKVAGLNRLHNKLLYKALSTVNDRFIHPNGMSIIKGKINILIDGRNYDNATVLSDTIEETIPSGIWEFDEKKGLYHKHSFCTTKSGSTITDYGQTKIFGAGAIAELNLPNTDSGRNGTFLAGASYYTNTTTIVSGIFYDDSNDTLQKAGYLVTPKLLAIDGRGMPSVQNSWQNIYTLYRYLLDSNDKITVKFRNKEIDSVIAIATWTSNTTFTTPTDLSALVGYEVEPILGLGSGKTSHITIAVFSAGSCTVTVDETYTGATSTSQVRIQNWKKISTITSGEATYDQAGIGPISNWCQFKLGMIFTGRDELETLLIINQNFNPAN